MEIAATVANWSKDRSRQVGCVIVSPQKDIKATGYNGFPRGVNDELEARHERPAKYLWTEHAERNAIYAAARLGTSLESCTIYIPWFPCMDCARAIVQSGIATIVAYMPDMNDPKWGQDFITATELLKEANVEVRYLGK